MNLVGIILNGGKSSRMGTDKSGLVYQGKSLLEHMQHLLKNAGVSNVYISGAGGMSDIIPDRGPLGGIYSVMQQLTENQEVLIAPIDMPLLSVDILSSLRGAKQQGDASHFEGFIMPLKLRLSSVVRKHIEATVTDGSKSLSVKSLLNKINVAVIDIPKGSDDCFINTNTPDEWIKMNSHEPAELRPIAKQGVLKQ